MGRSGTGSRCVILEDVNKQPHVWLCALKVESEGIECETSQAIARHPCSEGRRLLRRRHGLRLWCRHDG